MIFVLSSSRYKRNVIYRNPEHFSNLFGFSWEDQDLLRNFDKVSKFQVPLTCFLVASILAYKVQNKSDVL